MVLHFTKLHPEFCALAWLCHNAGACERENLNGIIKVEDVDGVIHCVSTDAHRMPIVRYKKDCPLEIGYYKISKKSKTDLFLEKTEIDIYPNWQKLFPKTDSLIKIERPNSEFHFTKSKFDGFLQTDLFFVFLNGCCVNYEWLEDAGAFFEADWEVYHSESMAVLHGMSIKKKKELAHSIEYEHDYFKFSLLAMKVKVPNYPAKENGNSDEQNQKKTMKKRGKRG